MKEFNASTKRGRNLIKAGMRHEGLFLSQVYKSWSKAKENAYERCLEQFYETVDGNGFGICSHNLYGFTCSWFGKQDGEHIMRYETKDDSYLVWLDR